MNPDEELAHLLEAVASRGLAHGAPRVEAAFRLAVDAHAGQTRSDGTPYVLHPLAVARLLLEQWPVEDPDLLVAALLHDVVEDTAVTLEQVEAQFGPKVAVLVHQLTKRPAGPDDDLAAKRARTAEAMERLAAGPTDAVVVKAADRYDNLRDVVGARWPEAKKRGYVQETLELVLPVLDRHGLAAQAGALRRLCADVLARLDRGEGDLPDVGPEEDLAGVAPPAEAEVLRRSRHLSFFRNGEDLFLYHDLVGDIMQLHEKVVPYLDFFAEPRPEAAARPVFRGEFLDGDLDAFVETFREHLCLLADGEDDEAITARWYPLRGPWLLSHRPAGGALTLCYKDRRDDAVVLEELSPFLGRLFELCTGKQSLPEVIARLEREMPTEPDVERRALEAVRAWTHSRRQLLKLIPRARDAYEMVGLPPYTQSTMPYPRWREGEAPPPELSLERYHREAIRSADEQFERRETTISHALRVPHPALENRPFGGQLARVLLERDLIVDDGTRAPFVAVEVGGGTGACARAFLDALALRAPRIYNRLRYHVVDLSPALQAAQRERLAPHKERVRLVCADARALPFPPGSVHLLLANEMIADLPVLTVRREEVPEGAGPGPEMIRRFGLPVGDAPGVFSLNYGAIEAIEEVARVLAPGGTAYLSEFGSPQRYPERSTHLDHPEHSIHFGHVKAAAERLGLEAGLEQLAALLKLDGRVEVLQTTQSFFDALHALFAKHGAKLEKVAYTKDMLQELAGRALDLDRVEGLRFAPCGARLLGLKPPEFMALLLRRPRHAGRSVQRVAVDV